MLNIDKQDRHNVYIVYKYTGFDDSAYEVGFIDKTGDLWGFRSSWGCNDIQSDDLRQIADKLDELNNG